MIIHNLRLFFKEKKQKSVETAPTEPKFQLPQSFLFYVLKTNILRRWYAYIKNLSRRSTATVPGNFLLPGTRKHRLRSWVGVVNK